MTDPTPSISLACGNCGWQGLISPDVGVVDEDGRPHSAAMCPRCGVAEVASGAAPADTGDEP